MIDCIASGTPRARVLFRIARRWGMDDRMDPSASQLRASDELAQLMSSVAAGDRTAFRAVN